MPGRRARIDAFQFGDGRHPERSETESKDAARPWTEVRRARIAALLALTLLAGLIVPGRPALAAAEMGPGGLPALRIAVAERGMVRLSYEALKAAGAPLDGLDPAQLALWQREQPVAVELVGAEDGLFGPGDALIFYGESYAGRYMTRNLYRLTWSGAAGKRMAARAAAPGGRDQPASLALQRARVEFNRAYYSAYADLPRDADHLFDNPLYPNSVVPTAVTTYTLDLPDLAPGTALLTVVAHGGRDVADRDPDQSLRLRLNGVDLGSTTWDGSVRRVMTETVSSKILLPNENELMLEAALSQLSGIDYYWVSPDWVEIAYPAKARASADRFFTEAALLSQGATRVHLPFVAGSAPAGLAMTASAGGHDFMVGGFTGGGLRAYDVANPRQPVRLTGVTELALTGSRAAVFAAQPEIAYAVVSNAGFLAPAALEYDAGSDLQSTDRRADYIAIVHRSLWDAIQPLLNHRAAEGFAVAKVDVQDIYDEFSGGMVDPEAIRAFLSYAYHQWNAGGARPQYVLLVGDGHYDFKGELRPGAPNLIPPYLLGVDPYIGETAADNRYASVDGDDDFLPDMALGRIPARTPAEVTAVVDKVLAYEKDAPAGDWQRRAVFMADPQDDSAGNFHALSDQARALVPPLYATQPIYSKSGPTLDTAAEMKATIRAAYDSGALYVQWFGHAARASWSKDRVWEVNDSPKLAANTVWPLTAHYSCWSGYFINITPSGQYGNSDQSLAEGLLLTPKRGSLADFAPSGLHVGGALEGLNKALVKAIFIDRIDRIGKATDAARKAYFDSGAGAVDVIDTQVLLGDPATRLKLP